MREAVRRSAEVSGISLATIGVNFDSVETRIRELLAKTCNRRHDNRLVQVISEHILGNLSAGHRRTLRLQQDEQHVPLAG